MGMKKNLCRGIGSWSLPVLLSVFLFASCKDDLQTSVHTGPGIRFSVSDRADWHATRVVGSPEEETAPRDSLLGVLPLQAGDGSDGLYLHALLSDNTRDALPVDESIGTRSAPVKDMGTYKKFGVFAYLYTGAWDGSAAPDFMYNTEIHDEGGVWSPAVDYNWPGKGRKLRFFAYAPYNTSGIVLPVPHEVGYPDFTYNVPEKVQDQKDLLVAASGEMAGDHNAMAPLTFRHTLTAVRFVVGDDMQKGKVTEITLRNVYGRAVYGMDSGLWSAFGQKKDFSQKLDKKVDGQTGEEITPEAATFMMIPQQLPQNAEVEVVFTDDMTGTERTLKAPIAGTTWPGGKTVTYRISTSSISIIPTFTMTAPDDFTYAGGDKNYLVTSYASVSRPGDPTKTVSMTWTTEFVEDDGNGGYKVIARPNWLKAFIENGNGSTAATKYTATVAAQQGITSNPHNDALQAAPPVNGIYDLSTTGGTTVMRTANCYVINAPGTYSLPLVYGNAIDYAVCPTNGKNISAYTSQSNLTHVLKNFVNHLDMAITDPYIYNNIGCIPQDAVLVWQDEEELVSSASVRLTDDDSNGTFDHLQFEVPEKNIRQGNAIVAVRDADNCIMWSWHIWITDFVPGLVPIVEECYSPVNKARDKVVTNSQGVKYTFMGANIGWCDAETTTYDARSVKVLFTQTETNITRIITLTQTPHATVNPGNQPYFQFGRKDPMLGGILNASGFSIDKDCYSDSYAFDKLGTGKVTIGISIQNPYVFYNYGGVVPQDWCSTSYYNLWSADNTVTTPNDNTVVKTIYDPSPIGYHLPASNAFTGFTYNGNYTSGSFYGSQFNSPYTSANDFTTNTGWMFFCNKMNGIGRYDNTGGMIFFPASGQRYFSKGKVYDVGSISNIWTAVPYSMDSGYYLVSYLSCINPLNFYYRSSGYAVRPVRE